MNRKNPKVDEHIASAKKWQPELRALRRILLDTELTEELKWDQPCYTYGGANIVLLGGFKDHCALMFCQGFVLKDPHGILKKPGEHTQAARLILAGKGIHDCICGHSKKLPACDDSHKLFQ